MTKCLVIGILFKVS